jgi:hypothetical protein
MNCIRAASCALMYLTRSKQPLVNSTIVASQTVYEGLLTCICFLHNVVMRQESSIPAVGPDGYLGLFSHK